MTRSQVVTEDDVHNAVEYLRASAIPIGKARSEAIKTEKMLSHIEALMTLKSDLKSQDAKRAEARASDRYVDAINTHAEAAGGFDALKASREAASAVIEAWRTQSATIRQMQRVA